MNLLRYGVGLLVGLCIVACSGPRVLAQDATSRVEAKEATPTQKPSSYTRVSRVSGVVSLEIASREFKSSTPGQPSVWLVGASHIGDVSYFAALQKHIDGKGLVLFEGVGFDPYAEPPKDKTKEGGKEDPDHQSLQGNLARSLGLVFQLDEIDYRKPNFRNSDVTWDELQEIFRTGELPLRKKSDADEKVVPAEKPKVAKSDAPQPVKQDSPPAAPAAAAPAPPVDGEPSELKDLVGIMEGTSLMGAMMKGAVKMIGTSPHLQALTRLMMIELLGSLEGDLSDSAGLPPSMQNLMQVLIRARNEKVAQDLEEALKGRYESVAIFYGAGHMDHLEQLLRKRGYTPGREEWFTAFAVDPVKAGLSKSETLLVRTMVSMQLQMLKKPGLLSPAAEEK